MAKAATTWDVSNWKKGPVTFFQALGLPSAKIHWPKLEPGFTKGLANAAPSQSSSAGTPSSGGGSKGPLPKAAGGYQNYAKTLLGHYGWGSQFTSFNAIVMSESSWNPTVKNPTSGAYGIAQALGHGQGSATQGTQSNNYGGYGLTDAQARAANSGNGYWQLVWMMNYIRETYGDPASAWAYHQVHNAY